jgi:4-hydroxy-tetrahydrodipicolinate synthase
MEKQVFSGCIVALVTPLLSDGSVDEKSLRGLVEFQIAQGIDGIVPCGTTGESATLGHDEQGQVIKIVVEQARRRVPIVAGAGSNSTQTAVALAKQAQAAGVDGILSVAPYYNKPTQEGLFLHFQAIARSVDLPVIVYNVPGRTSSNIEAATIFRLSEIANVTGVKEASGNMAQIMEILRNKPPHFSVLSGDDALTLPMLALGADGLISVAANEAPRLMRDMVAAGLKGDFANARALHHRLLPLMNVNFIESSPIPVKAALAMMGKIQETYRLPLCPMREENRTKLAKVLKELALT